MQLYPATSFGDKADDLNPEHWAHEGFENAKKYVYTTPENQPPSTSYLTTGKQVAEQQAALDQITKSMINKILHPAIEQLKQMAHDPDGAELSELVRKIFNVKPQ